MLILARVQASQNVHKMAVFHFACFSTWKLQMLPYGVIGIDKGIFHCAVDEHDVMDVGQRSNAW